MTFEEIRNAVNAAWRDYVVNGVPSSGVNDPVKQEIRAALLKITVALENGGFSAPPNWAADLADVQSKLDDVDAVVAGLGTVSAKALEAQAAASAAVAARDDAVQIYGSIEAVEAAAATATDAIDQVLEIAAGSPEAPSILNKVNRDGSNARGDFLTTVGAATEFLPLTGIEWIENPAWVNILASRLNDGRLYSIQGARLCYSVDFGQSWTPIGPSGVTGGRLAHSILPLGDGEVLLATSSTLYKTVGWPSSTFTTKLVFTNPTTSTFLPWGVDTTPSGLAVATAYQAGSLAGFEQSRYVWLSQNNGETWSVIRDLDAVGKNDQHIHFAVFDPWQNNRIYIGHHNYDNVTGSGKVIEYSDDRGATWTPLDINLTVGGVSIIAQPTTAVATSGGIVFGSDDALTGLFVLRRGNTKLEFMAEGPAEDFNTTVRSFATYSQADPETGVIYTCYNQASQGGHSFIMASDWRAGSVVLDDGAVWPIGSALPGFKRFAITSQGIVALTLRPSSADPAVQVSWVLRARRSERGRRRFDSGRLEGGTIGFGNVRNTAGGYGSIADGGRSAAYGYKAKAGSSSTNVNAAFGPGADAAGGDRATALGGDSKASSQATAVGTGAIAGAQSVALGNNAGQEGAYSRLVVIGQDAKARAQSVAIGAGASADLGAQAVAVGEMSSASNFGVALGRSAVAAGSCVAVGHSANAAGEGVAVGLSAKATSSYGTAIGPQSEAAFKSVALGRQAKAPHNNSVALGSELTTTRADQVLVGGKDIEITNPIKGLVLSSPDGSKWRVTISDAGVAAWAKFTA